MYFGEIFRALRDLRPRMAVAVRKGQELDNPYGIDLRPVLRFVTLANERVVGGTRYDAAIGVPHPSAALALRRLDPDAVIIIEFGLLSLLATIATLGRRTARLLLVESDPALRGGRTSGAVLVMKRWIARRAHTVQTNNEAGRRFIETRLGVAPERILVAPYLTSRPPGRNEASAPDGPVRILFANTLNERKNARLLLEALALCDAATRAAIRLTIVGDGPERPALEAMASALGPEGDVRFVGAVPYRELGRYYADADILAIPSRADYRSLSGFEGLGYGLALLASAADGATSETVRDGETGFALDPDRAEDWARALARFVADRALLAHCRHGAMRLYEERFSIETIAKNVANGVDRALAERSGHRAADPR